MSLTLWFSTIRDTIAALEPTSLVAILEKLVEKVDEQGSRLMALESLAVSATNVCV